MVRMPHQRRSERQTVEHKSWLDELTRQPRLGPKFARLNALEVQLADLHREHGEQTRAQPPTPTPGAIGVRPFAGVYRSRPLQPRRQTGEELQIITVQTTVHMQPRAGQRRAAKSSELPLVIDLASPRFLRER